MPREWDTKALQEAFLAAYEHTGLIGESARFIGIGVCRHRVWFLKDADYRRRFAESTARFNLREKYDPAPPSPIRHAGRL